MNDLLQYKLDQVDEIRRDAYHQRCGEVVPPTDEEVKQALADRGINANQQTPSRKGEKQ